MTSRNQLPAYDLPTPSIKEMAQEVLRDISESFSLNTNTWTYDAIKRLAMIPARRFAHLMQYIDTKIRSHPVWEVARDILPRFTTDWQVTGGHDLPREGPLLVVGNHPGAVDSIAALAAVERADVHLLANKRPTLTAMPNASNHIFYLDTKNPVRIDVMRGLINILKRGETVVLFPKGNLEPDPARYSGALESLKDWSQSLGVFLSQVPETMLQVILAKNVITPQAWNHPIATMAKTTTIRHQLAMVLQMVSQEIFGIWKEPIELMLPAPIPARQLARDLDPRAINTEIRRFVAGEMEKTFENL